MTRLPRLCPPGIPQHVIQRGNNRQVCFSSDEDFSAYAYWLHEYSEKYHVSIHAWVFVYDKPCSFINDAKNKRWHFKVNAIIGSSLCSLF